MPIKDKCSLETQTDIWLLFNAAEKNTSNES